MRKIRVELQERSYNIAVESGILSSIGKALEKFEFGRKIAVVSNPTVYPLFGPAASESLKDAGFEVIEILIPDGEEYKNMASVQKIHEEMLKAGLDRKSAMVALGGGVIGDITGFAASIYMRGIDFIQIPTTLLAQVDSSVGGKTGVNHPLGKNMIGTFWQPRLVWIDIQSLSALPRREFLSGLGEVIKYGVIWDERLFEFLEVNRERVLGLDYDSLEYIIGRSCEIKAEIVSKDERESGIRAILNYGHTIGHAIETATGYKNLLHGEAVAIGMCLEAKLARSFGLAEKDMVSRIESLVKTYELPAGPPENLDLEGIISAMSLDKKSVSGRLHFILPEKIGAVKIHKVTSEGDIRGLFLS